LIIPFEQFSSHLRLIKYAGLVFATAFATATCAADAVATTEPIKIGVYASLTGKEAVWGQSAEKATRLAIDDVNTNGGVLGRPLLVIIEDNQSKPGESVTAVRKLISRDKVIAILGEASSGRSLEAAPICQQARIPMISGGSNPKVTQVGSFIFRTHFIDPFQGTVMSRFAREKLGAKRLALITEVTNAYAVGLAKYFSADAEAHRTPIIIEQKYSAGERDFKSQLTAIKAAQVDAIFVPGYYTEAGLIVAQARELGLDIPVLGGDGWEGPQLVAIGGSALRETYYCNNFSSESDVPETRRFIARYQERFHSMPGGTAADAYDAVLMLTDAIKRAGSTEAEKIRAALATTRGLRGVGGPLNVDANRDQLKPAYILGYNSGDYHLVQVIQP
jgi:branched-chain amino acid transport system substrate-binding protein